MAGERWVVDGNYGSTFDVRFARADTVIVLALPRWVCVCGGVLRKIRNRGRELQAPGCPERLTMEFLRWVWSYPTRGRPRLDAALDRHPHLKVIELTSRRHARVFLDGLDHAET